MRPIPEAVLGLVHEFEGRNGTFEPTRTQDPVGNWEIGYSHKLSGPDDEFWDSVLDQDFADHLAMQDEAEAAQAVCAALGVAVNNLTDNQYAACIDLTYNIGGGNFANSTLCSMIKAGQITEAADQFDRWVYAGGEVMPGLVTRRAAEKTLYLT